MKNTCKICKKTIVGRSDKIFCSVHCKNYYHSKLRKATDLAVAHVNSILHRNRSILLEFMGKNATQKKVDRAELEKKNFQFSYHTQTYMNSQKKIYHYVYDFAWMEFSTLEILIVRKKGRGY